ncbi:alpha/beta hydrolase [Pararhodobacter sp. SW119]|uniref:alpha/beta fold hydrolase n=1 Tax=Pararhodobacter sp. SW119 TaxID=2780075 RepID=UPI001FD7468B|nr:alpha/beta hydrolase [Pararhodobacter sp. SW119]
MAGFAAAPLADCDAAEGGRAVWLQAGDGRRLRLALWPGARHVLLLPGRTEWIEKYGQVVGQLATAGWGALVLDWRGQGLSDRLAPDSRLGHVARFSDYQIDLHAALDAARTLAPGPLPILAHSMGGCILLRALVEGLRPPAVALSAPMWGLEQPFGLSAALRAGARLTGPFGRDAVYTPTTGPDYGLASMPYDDNPLTRDRARFERMKAQIAENPDLVIGGPSLRWLAGALVEMRALARAPSPPVPALVGLGGNERIVSPRAIRRRAAAWSEATLVDYPEAEHELLMERDAVRDDFLRRTLALFAGAVD